MGVGGVKKDAARLALRILLAFGLYWALGAVWLAAGLDEVYDALVLDAGLALVPLLSHFPLGQSTIDPVMLHNQGYVLVLAFSLFLVSTRLPWKSRLLRFAAVPVFLVACQVVSMTLQLHIDLGLRFQQSTGMVMFLPWELELERRLFQFFFAVGLQFAPFALVLLTAIWNADPSLWDRLGLTPADAPGRPRPGTWKRWALAGLGAVSALIAVAVSLHHLRERTPRHVAVHVALGDVFLKKQRPGEAELQYMAAVRGGSRDGRAWYNLVLILYRDGRREAAAATARRGLAVVEDEEWRGRLEQVKQAAER